MGWWYWALTCRSSGVRPLQARRRLCDGRLSRQRLAVFLVHRVVGDGCKPACGGGLRLVSWVHLWHTASAVFRNHTDVVILYAIDLERSLACPEGFEPPTVGLEAIMLWSLFPYLTRVCGTRSESEHTLSTLRLP